VLHPIGWDAFGLPAEQHAVKTGTHPASNTQNNITNFKRQIKRSGSRLGARDRHDLPEVLPLDAMDLPAVVPGAGWPTWTSGQSGGARNSMVANEEVVDGKSEVGGFPVQRRKPMRQWVLRITAYAERLLADLNAARMDRTQPNAMQRGVDRPQRRRCRSLFRPRGSAGVRRHRCSPRGPTRCHGCDLPRAGAGASVLAAHANAGGNLSAPPSDAYRKAAAAARSDLERTEL
jgi:leucyl-tRNA synthetase